MSRTADALINAIDSGLRTLFATPHASRALDVPTDNPPLNAAQQRDSASLMRVNHVGEVCAQGLYAAQALGAQLLIHVDVLVVNEGELLEVVRAHTGAQPSSIAAAVRAVPVPTVVVTLGTRGCCAWVQDTLLVQPAFEVAVVDSTGAGDTFCGALTAALAQGQDMAQALRWASAAGALACTQLGAQSSIPTAQAVAQLLAQDAQAGRADAVAALRAYCHNTWQV